VPSKNDITGDVIKSKVGTPDKYADGWERIFGNKTQKTENVGNEDLLEKSNESKESESSA